MKSSVEEPKSQRRERRNWNRPRRMSRIVKRRRLMPRKLKNLKLRSNPKLPLLLRLLPLSRKPELPPVPEERSEPAFLFSFCLLVDYFSEKFQSILFFHFIILSLIDLPIIIMRCNIKLTVK
jgi:hypothetical protein